MSEKRRLSTRSKGESPLEKRIKSEQAALKKPGPVPKGEKKKVTKIHARGRRKSTRHEGTDLEDETAGSGRVETTPLPLAQSAENVRTQSLQSIAESGVLASALQRSRVKWSTDGIFQRHWTKPKTHKGKVIEPPGNPPKNSMKSLGKCRITVEPHVLEANLYTINETSQPAVANAMSRPIMHYNPPSAAASYTQPTSALPPKAVPGASIPVHQKPLPPPATSVPPSTTSSTIQTPQQTTQPSVQRAPAPPAPPAQPQQAVPKAPMSQAPAPAAPRPPNPPPQNQDPVIHMLAQRASSNPQLKDLMKIVANGNATKEQLSAFQRHIDELNAIIAQQRALGHLPPAPLPLQKPPQTQQNPTMRPPAGIPPHHAYPPPNYPNATRPYVAPPPPPKAKPQSTTRAVGIAIEFPPSTERFLFPKHTMLEVYPGGMHARASFLVVRRGQLGQGAAFEPGKEYNQPVTIYLTVEDPRVMHTIHSTLASPEETRKHMESVVARSVRAEAVSLALRIPKAAAVKYAEDEIGLAQTAAERRRSLKAAAGTRDPLVTADNTTTSSTTKVKQPKDEFAGMCRYCFREVSGPTEKDADGKPVCTSCNALVQKAARSSVGSLAMFQKAPEQERERRGPLTLMLEA